MMTQMSPTRPNRNKEERKLQSSNNNSPANRPEQMLGLQGAKGAGILARQGRNLDLNIR